MDILLPELAPANAGEIDPLPLLTNRVLRIGIIDNSKAGARAIVETLAKRVGERAEKVVLERVRKTHASLPMADEDFERLTATDVAFLALGDCGSCTSWTVHDAVRLEAAGVPSVVVCSEPFEDFARTQAAALGVDNLRLLVLEHPIAELPENAVVARCTAALSDFDGFFATSEAILHEDRPAALQTARGREVSLVSLDIANEDLTTVLLKRQLTDGLPVVEPTRPRIEAALAEYDADPDELLGEVAPRYGRITPRHVALSAVTAGCLPEYLPVVVAAVRAVLAPEFNLNGLQTTTHPCSILTIVSGPVAERIGMNSGINAFGPGNRANATIGRALRLALLACGGSIAGNGDMATLGSPAKYTYAVAENVASSPWATLAETMGHERDADVVTVIGSEAPQNVNDHESRDGLGILRMVAGTMRSTGINNSYYVNGQVLIVFSPEHAKTIHADGYSRQEVQNYLWQEGRTPIGYFSEGNIRQRLQTRFPREFAEYGPHTTVPVVHAPENVLLTVIGGPGKHSMFVPTFGATRAVSRPVSG